MNMAKQSLLTPAYYGTGRVIVAYSGFGLLKTATALIKCDLYCILPVKPAHRGFLRKFLNNTNFSRGKCAAFKADIEAAKGQVNNFKMRN